MKRLIIILAVTLSSCTTKPDPELFLKNIGITLQDKYEMVKNETSFAIGESLVQFTIKISKVDYESLVDQIEGLENYQDLSEGEMPSSEMSGSIEEIRKVGWKRNGTYCYDIYIPDSVGKGWDSYLLYLKADRTLDFQYVDE